MESGFNSNVVVRGLGYHIQTEDWGQRYKCIVSQIFRNGAVIKTVKVGYDDLLVESPVPLTASLEEALRHAMREQHQRILDLLLSGQVEGV